MWLGNGVLFTRGPSTYKIPGFNDVPLDFRVELLADAPNPRAIHSSKGVGEPPLFLSASVFFGILPLFLPTLPPLTTSHPSHPFLPPHHLSSHPPHPHPPHPRPLPLPYPFSLRTLFDHLQAIRDAIAAARADAGKHGYFALDSPATCERIRIACEDAFTAQFTQEKQ